MHVIPCQRERAGSNPSADQHWMQTPDPAARRPKRRPARKDRSEGSITKFSKGINIISRRMILSTSSNSRFPRARQDRKLCVHECCAVKVRVLIALPRLDRNREDLEKIRSGTAYPSLHVVVIADRQAPEHVAHITIPLPRIDAFSAMGPAFWHNFQSDCSGFSCRSHRSRQKLAACGVIAHGAISVGRLASKGEAANVVVWATARWRRGLFRRDDRRLEEKIEQSLSLFASWPNPRVFVIWPVQ